MTENPQPATSRNQTAALAGLAVLVILVLVSPLGWDYLIPQVWASFGQGLDFIGQAAAWLWHNTLAPVFGFLGSIFA